MDQIKSNELLNIETIWNKKLAQDIKELWKDEGIQATYQERHNFQLDDSAK